MHLINYISELLYDHNCVIVPGFGGFVANFKATEFKSDNNSIQPSRKIVAFNQSLVENDGLLTQYVSKKLKISYSQAENSVKDLSRFIWERLDQYKNIEFRNIGTVYLNKDNKLVFVPYKNHNFHLKSYGLPGIKIKPIKEVERASTDREPVTGQSSESGKKRSLWRYWGAAATLILFASAFFFGKQFSDPFAYNKVNLTSNPGVSDTESLGSIVNLDNTSDKTEPVESPVEVEPEVEESEMTTDIEAEEATEAIEVSEPETIEVPEIKTTPEPESDPVTSEVTETRKERLARLLGETTTYHIIAATTLTREEAQTMIHSSLFSGFNAKILDEEQSDRVLISIETFTSEKFAKQYLNEIKRHNFRQAWLLETNK